MNNLKKRYIFLVIIIAIMLISMRSIGLEMSHYQVNCFNDTLKINSLSTYYNDVYYYVDDEKYIYELSNDNNNKCLIKATNILGISVLGGYIYYISSEKLYRYNIETEYIELLDEECGYKYLSSNNEYVYALCFINGNFTNYRLLKVNDNEEYNFNAESKDSNTDITISSENSQYKNLCNNIPYKSFCGSVDKNNQIVFRSNDILNNNLLYFNDSIIITSDDGYKQMNVYSEGGNLVDTIDIPENYSYISQNVYSDDNSIYMLIQKQKGNNAIGYYNLPQNRHKLDALVKYNLENDTFSFIYTSNNKYERIVGYKENYIICLYNNLLYRINIHTKEKDKIAKINLSNAIFEICFNKIFIWNDSEYICSYNIT